ncbi:hypothetical protein MX838_004349 [Vibrio parahaemolyticus]|nr:hypothetical protein [Vibrio parahaemolyticus]EKL9826489.1 hypothetical protein [Vibrio parahaemolyticus]
MTTIRTTFEYQIDVNFLDIDKARSFFLKSDWKDCFYTFNFIEDVAKHLADNFHNYNAVLEKGKEWRHIEGFGSYYREPKTNTWRLDKDSIEEISGINCGDIHIHYYMETECSNVEYI